MLKALIFDVDGTLCATEELHRRAFNDTFHAFGLGWHWDKALYRSLLRVTGGKERIAHYVRNHHPLLEHSGRLPDLVKQVHAYKTATYTDLVKGGRPPACETTPWKKGSVPSLRPGVERLLREARQAGTRLAIATTTSLPNVVALLETTLGGEAIDWFDTICAGDSVPRKKPAPDVYEQALERLGMPPGQCVAIEDSAHGLTSAVTAGVATVVTPSEYTHDQDFGGARLVVDHLGDPEAPCTVIRGNALPAGVVDLAALNRLVDDRPHRHARHHAAVR